MRFFLGSSKDEQDGNQESSDDEEEEAKQESKYLTLYSLNLTFYLQNPERSDAAIQTCQENTQKAKAFGPSQEDHWPREEVQAGEECPQLQSGGNPLNL